MNDYSHGPTTRLRKQGHPYHHCHFTPMEHCKGDSNDIGEFEEWLECSFCGATKPLDPETDTRKEL